MLPAQPATPPTTAARRGCQAASKLWSTKTAGGLELVYPRRRAQDLPNGRKLVTLEDAARYIQKLPKAQHDLPHWQHAVEHLLPASAGSEAWLMSAHMFMLAMNHGVERVFNTDRKETHWGKRKLKRDE